MNRTLMAVALVSLASAGFALQEDAREIVTRGEIVAVSTDERTVTLEESADPATKASPDAMQTGVRRTFLVKESTKLTAAGEPIALADVQVGARATVHYVMDSGDNVALAIELRSPSTE